MSRVGLIKQRVSDCWDVRYQKHAGYSDFESTSAKDDMRYLLKEIETLEGKLARIEDFKKAAASINAHDRFHIEILLEELSE